MKHEPLFDAVSETTDAEACATLNVVIAYDDVPASQHAMHILADVAANFGDKLELRPQLWRFQFLEDPDWRTLAAKDVLNANMLIISTSSENELPAAVRSWFSSCLTQRRGANLAVVALLGTADKMDEPYSPRFQLVQRAVREASFDFFAPVPHPEDSLDASIASIRHRAETVTPILEDILHVPTAPLRTGARIHEYGG
jgi:hypothetical protein